jgi:hypothetical protein
MGQVRPRQGERVPLRIPTTHDEMRVGIGGVPVHRGHIVERVLEVTCHLPHEGLDEGHEMELPVVEHTDDYPELVRVVLRRVRKGVSIQYVSLRIKECGIRAIGPFALGEIPEVSARGAG